MVETSSIPMSCINILIADHQPVVLVGLKSILCSEKDFNVVASHSDGTECLHAMRRLLPDVALVGMFMPGVTGPEILAAATSERWCTRVVLVTASIEHQQLVAAAAWGAYGVVSTEASPKMLVYFLRQIAAGQLLPLALLDAEQKHEEERCPPKTLTQRERQIVKLVSEGLSNKEIGRRLDLSGGTSKEHMHRISRN